MTLSKSLHAILTAMLLLSGCAGNGPAPVVEIEGGGQTINSGRTHRVNGGETLYAIAWIYGLDYLDLARANNISAPYTIYPGQQLRVDLENFATAPATTVASPSPAGTATATSSRAAPAPEPSSASSPPDTSGVAATGPLSWMWPASGPLLGRFSSGATGNKGIDIGGGEGDAVRSAEAGEVVYAGRGLLRYGDLLIIKHNERFLSAYAHNSRLLVGEGDTVRRGQQIAELGSTGVGRDMLHFEIRMDGNPVDPLRHLPSR